MDIEGRDYVECKICHKKLKTLTYHITQTHGMTKEEYLDKYPSSILVCSNTKKSQQDHGSKSMSKNWENPEFRSRMSEVGRSQMELNHQNPEFIESQKNSAIKLMNDRWSTQEWRVKMSEVSSQIMTDNWSNTEFRRKMKQVSSEVMSKNWENSEFRSNVITSASKNLTNLWKDPEFRSMMSDLISNRNKENWNDPEYRDFMIDIISESSSKLWTSDEVGYGENGDLTFREMMKEVSSSNAKRMNEILWNDPEYEDWRRSKSEWFMSIMNSYKFYQYDGYIMRSSWEVYFAEKLNNNSIEYQYENKSIPYKYNDKIHYYYPDFYLPEYDLYVEIHPSNCMDDRMIAKIESLSNIIVLTENELFEDNLISMIRNLVQRLSSK